MCIHVHGVRLPVGVRVRVAGWQVDKKVAEEESHYAIVVQKYKSTVGLHEFSKIWSVPVPFRSALSCSVWGGDGGCPRRVCTHTHAHSLVFW